MRFHFDCVFYYVSDLDRAIGFYTATLGLQLLSRGSVARFDLDGVLFELVPAGAELPPLGGANARLCLRVDDMAQARAHLLARGVPTSEPQAKDTGLLSSFRDLDGNEICLWEYFQP